MAYRCRCVKCDTRKALKQHPKKYIRAPKCLICGHNVWYLTKARKGVSCNCGGYEFTHRKGSKYCYYHPDVDRIQTERKEKI